MKVYLHESARSIRRYSGAALVITLAMLILVSFVVVAFLGRSTREAVLVGGAVGGQKADLLASSAAELIIADLNSEMRAGSTETIVDGVAIMEPDTAATAMPSQARLSATSGAVFDNLIKQSGAPAGMFLNTAPYDKISVTELIPAATTTPTTTASVDGRTVSEARWNAPQLLVGGSFGANEVPNWVLMDRVGVVPPTSAGSPQEWNNLFRDSTPNNDRFIIGRFAYNIYDVSGLLDINVAGYPNTITATSYTSGSPQREVGRKGGLAMADIGLIPGVTSMDDFVAKWRNLLTKNSDDFLAYNGINQQWNADRLFDNKHYNFGPKYGFQKVANSASDSDNRILSRQDLIKLATNGSNGISTAALPYLTHFSRAVSAPSWSPTTPAGSSKDYNADRNEAGSTNRFLPNVRVSGTFTRADGTAAQQGESLLKTRFPLSRLALLQKDAIPSTPAWDLTPETEAFVNNFEARRIANGGSALGGVTVNEKAAWLVQLVFGLVWSSDRWLYAGPSDSTALNTIATLGSISGREPNFFELLKASILSGSLGRSLGKTLVDTKDLDEDPDNQIIQIGLNIIDQYDADSFPTKITFNSNDFAGIENLPYLTRVFSHFYRSTADPDANRAYWMAEVWNPHQQKANANGPTRFRFAAAGKSVFKTGSLEDPALPADTPPNGFKNNLSDLITHSITDLGTPEFVANAANENFKNPTLLIPLNGATANAANMINELSVEFVGIYAGRVVCKDTLGLYPAVGAELVGDPVVSFYLQYKDGAQWVTYQSWNGIKWSGVWDYFGNRPAGSTSGPAMYAAGADPRSTRFGIIGNYCHKRAEVAPAWRDQSYEDSLYNTLRPDSTKAYDTIWTSLPYGAGLRIGGPDLPAGWGSDPLADSPDAGYPAYRFGYLAENKDTLPTYYRDNDNILRNGDAVYASGAWGQPLEQVNSAAGLASRPVILDRPFRSVAEMGYAFRDLPYKSVDFFTKNSADAALLDVFSVNESPVSGVTAGVLNPNTRHKPVLKAVLANVLKNELDAASTLDAATEADKIATKITTATAGTPLKNPSDIATGIIPDNVLTSAEFSGNDAFIKTRRESVVRALADVSNTRTWNLLVDLVMQSGRYPNSATAVDKFSVDGERRYWLHLAIDRYTGQVVARSMEPVNE